MYSIEALMLQIDEPISKVSFQNLFSFVNLGKLSTSDEIYKNCL